jgi:hypothetical protein
MNSTARRTLAAAIFAIAATASATDAQWTAAPLGATSASIATDGTLKYAYARGDYTVNGVAFANEGTDGIDNANCKVDITHDASNTPPADTESGDYKNLLGAGWYAYPGDRTVTLRNLEAGKKYLVQIIASRSDFTTQTATAPDGEHTIRFGGTDWEYGGSLVGVFTAESATQQFTIVYAGNSWLNGIQVRELAGDLPPDPVIGGGEGGDTPFAVGEDSVSIAIANAVEGATYFFKKSPTLADLDAASVDPRTFTATSNGVLRIVIPIEAGEESSCFYRFGVQ